MPACALVGPQEPHKVIIGEFFQHLKARLAEDLVAGHQVAVADKIFECLHEDLAHLVDVFGIADDVLWQVEDFTHEYWYQ